MGRLLEDVLLVDTWVFACIYVNSLNLTGIGIKHILKHPRKEWQAELLCQHFD